jgi:3-dehydroquinate dehydratase
MTSNVVMISTLPSKMITVIDEPSILLASQRLASLTKDANTVEVVTDKFKLEDFKKANFINLKDLAKVPVILKFQSLHQPSKTKLDPQVYHLLAQEILQIGFDYVDLAMPEILQLDSLDKHPQTKLIVSYNHTSHTPGYRNLRKLQKRMRGFLPAITKFHTQIKTQKDLENLMRLLVSRKKAETLWIQATGKQASEFNQISPKFGNWGQYIDN